MEFSISKRDFLRCLARTHAVADRKSSMPILSNILLATEGTTLDFRTDGIEAIAEIRNASSATGEV